VTSLTFHDWVPLFTKFLSNLYSPIFPVAPRWHGIDLIIIKLHNCMILNMIIYLNKFHLCKPCRISVKQNQKWFIWQILISQVAEHFRFKGMLYSWLLWWCDDGRMGHKCIQHFLFLKHVTYLFALNSLQPANIFPILHIRETKDEKVERTLLGFVLFFSFFFF
jgi:hypothetical protein